MPRSGRGCRLMVVVTRLPAKNGLPTLRAETMGGRQVFLHSSYDPQAEAENWAGQLQPRFNSLLVLFGLGMGYHVKALLPLAADDTQIIVVEPNPEVLRLAREWEDHQSSLQDPRVHLVSGWDDFKATYQQIATPWENLFFCRIDAYKEVYSSEYRTFIEKLKKEVNNVRSNVTTAVMFASQWQRNLFKNLCHLPRSTPVAQLFDRFHGKPAIVVSAGPSLMKNIDYLAQAKGKALIVAVGTVTRLLIERGIRPDFVMSFDGGLANYLHHFKDLDIPDAPLVFDPAVHYKVVENYRGPKVMMLVQGGNLWIEKVAGRAIGFLKVGNSIANTALDFVFRLGADPIVLVGQDIAYGEQGSHAERTFADGYDRSLQLSDEVQWVEGVDGGTVRTDNRMLTYLHCFEESIRTMEGKRTVIDATEGGARIKGTRIQALSEVLEQYCQKDLSDILASLRRHASQPPEYDLGALWEHLRDARLSLESLTVVSRTGLKLSERLMRHFAGGQRCKVEKVLVKLQRVDGTLRAEIDQFALIHYLMSVVEMFRRSTGDGEDDELAVSQRSYQLYSILKQAFEFALPLIGEAEAFFATEAGRVGKKREGKADHSGTPPTTGSGEGVSVAAV